MSHRCFAGATPQRRAWASQAAEKREFLEGDGLQAVHNCFVVNAALAAEGAAFALYSTFFRNLISPQIDPASVLEPLCANRQENRRSLHSATPDFLLSLVALAILMRLSLTKAAHAAMSSVAWQEIRVRSGRDDKFVARRLLIIQWMHVCPWPNKFVIPPAPACRGSSRLACASRERNEHGKAVFAIQAQRAGTKNQPSPEGLGP